MQFSLPPLVLALLGLATAAGHGSAQEMVRASANAPALTTHRRPKIGLVLSGGGARGVAHVGVLKALAELHVPVDYIAGTSMGALVGGLNAGGLPPAEIEKVFEEADWHYLLSDAPPRESQSYRSKQRDFDMNQNIQLGISPGGEVQIPAGLVAGRKLLVKLRELTLPVRNVADFDHLPIPFRAVATDLGNGDKVVLDHGDLADTMRASMAVPGVFTPHRIGNRLLVDGGLSSNLPIDVVRAMGAEVVIAVDVSSALYKENELTSALAVTDQVLNIVIQRDTQAQVRTLGPRDIYLRLPLADTGSASFLASAKGIPVGYAETMRHAAELRALAVPPAEYAHLAERQNIAHPAGVELSFVRVEGPDGPAQRDLQEKIPFEAGERLEFSSLNNYLVGLDGMRGYEVTDFRLVEDGGKTGLLLKTRKKADGPNYLHVGAELAYGTPANAAANLLAEWRMTELNSLGGTWDTLLSLGTFTRLFSEFYQPVTPARYLFVAPSVRYAGQIIDARDAGDDRRRFTLQTATLDLDAGVRLGQIGELRVGYEFGASWINRPLGLPEGVEGATRRGQARASLGFDTLDRTGFPTKGWFERAEVSVSDPALGGTDTYGRLGVELLRPITFGNNTVVPRVKVGLRLGGNELPYYDRFALGGFLNMSGFTRADLYDQNSLLAELVYYRRLARLPPGLGDALYGGFSLEAGNVWARLRDVRPGKAIYGGSVFVGADTLLGPVYLGLGGAASGNGAFYLQLSPAFGRGRLER